MFTSWGKETPKVFTQADIQRILTALDSGDYGKILRAKGIVNGEGGAWIEFDFVPEEHEVRAGHPDYTGRLCVIGAELKEDKLAELFGLCALFLKEKSQKNFSALRSLAVSQAWCPVTKDRPSVARASIPRILPERKRTLQWLIFLYIW